MRAVSAWIVDPQGRPVPGVDVLLTAQGWRGQRWAARSDADGRATFELPSAALRGAGTWHATVPAFGLRAAIDARSRVRIVVPVQRTAARAPAAVAPPDSKALALAARSADSTGRMSDQLSRALRGASPEAVAIATMWLGQFAKAPNTPNAGGM